MEIPNGQHILGKKLTPSAIVSYFDQICHRSGRGQEEAKKILAVVVYSHYQEMGKASQAGKREEHNMDTTNILFICAGAFVGLDTITTNPLISAG